MVWAAHRDGLCGEEAEDEEEPRGAETRGDVAFNFLR